MKCGLGPRHRASGASQRRYAHLRADLFRPLAAHCQGPAQEPPTDETAIGAALQKSLK